MDSDWVGELIIQAFQLAFLLACLAGLVWFVKLVWTML